MDGYVLFSLAFILVWVAVFVWLLLGALSYRVWPASDPYDKSDLQIFALISGPAYLPMRGALRIAACIMEW